MDEVSFECTIRPLFVDRAMKKVSCYSQLRRDCNSFIVFQMTVMVGRRIDEQRMASISVTQEDARGQSKY